MSDLDLFSGYDTIEASSGYDGDPLPTGWYPVAVEKVLDVNMSKNGSVIARMQLSVKHGDAEGKKAFVSMVLSPSAMNKDGSQRSNDETLRANKNIQAQMKGFLKALAVTTGQPVGDRVEEKFSNFYNLHEWPGREFVSKINRQEGNEQFGPSNRLNAYYALDDEKKGMDWWLRTEAAKTETATTSAGTI